MGMSGLLEAGTSMKDVWNSVQIMYGEQSVTSLGTIKMPELCAHS